MEKLYDKYLKNKHLYFLALLNFVIIYSSSFIAGYGYFIDEFYYIACANNPAFGYVDHPPLAPLTLMLYKFIFGDSILAIRFLPSLASSITVIIAGIITRELNGRKLSEIFSAICIITAPVFPVFASFYSMNSFEPLIISSSILFTLKIIKSGNTKYWLTIGALLGLSLLNKHTAGVFIIIFIFSLLLTMQRILLFNKYSIIGGFICFVIIFPNIIWQISNSFPSIEFYRNLSDKNISVGFFEFIKGQLFGYSFFLAPVWISGVIALIFSKRFIQYKFLGLIFLFVFIFMLLNGQSRFDRTSFAYPLVIPAGAIFIDELLTKIKLKWLIAVEIILLFGWLGLILPLFNPYLSYSNSEKLTSVVTNFFGINTEIERGKKPKIFQTLSDRIGWQEKVDIAGKVYQSLSEEDKNKCIIATTNYGMAGALELLGEKFNFPDIVSGHNNYFLWSKNRLHGDIILQVGNTNMYEGLKESFGKVDTTGIVFINEYVSPQENNITIFICRNPKYSYMELLESGKEYH